MNKATKKTWRKECSFLTKIILTTVIFVSNPVIALQSNKEHTAEDAAARAASFLDIGNFTDQEVRIWDVFYKVDDGWILYSNTRGDGFTLAPGEWSHTCQSVGFGYCYFNGASFTNVGWGLTELITNGNPRTNHQWKVRYSCSDDNLFGGALAFGGAMTISTSDDNYWHEMIITNCEDKGAEYSTIEQSDKVMEAFIEKTPYLSFSESGIISDVINQDSPDDGVDSESWDGMTSIQALEDSLPTAYECRSAYGMTPQEHGQVMRKDSLQDGCECRDVDQYEGEVCQDYRIVYYWDLPAHLIGNIDEYTELSLPWKYNHQLGRINGGDIGNGEELKEGTLLRVIVDRTRLIASPIIDEIDHVVTAGRQNRFQYTTDLGIAINQQNDIPIYAGEKKSNGLVQLVHGTQHRNKIWGQSSSDEVSIQRIDPVYKATIKGVNVTKGRPISLIIFDEDGRNKYRYDYIVPSDYRGKGWRWTNAMAKIVNADAEKKGLPFRAGRYRDDGTIEERWSTWDNKLWVATDKPNLWKVEIRY